MSGTAERELPGSRSRRLLEWPAIQEELAARCQADRAAALCRSLLPATTLEEAGRLQGETAEGDALWAGGQPPRQGLLDDRPLLDRLRRGGVLTAAELAQLGQHLSAAVALVGYVQERATVVPILSALVEELPDPRDWIDRIRRVVSPEGEILDGASPRLLELRQRQRDIRRTIRSRLEGLLRSSRWQRMLQDVLITERDGRFVLPVKKEFQAEAGGVVHDVSQSGATVFLEPLAVLPLNNGLAEALRGEAREIERILQEISAALAGGIDGLSFWGERAAFLDFVLAKGRYARDLDAERPLLSREGKIHLVAACHPLIPRARMVPIDLTLGDAFTTLVITGPNTGGKTVALKTVGLLALMASAGLFLPVREGSSVAVFREVLADIGDEQSIAQSLSTFSSHMGAIARILEQADHGSLVLLDELGAGTDPVEGAALAMTILADLTRRGTFTVATSHFSEVKYFAAVEPRVENASVAFDPETLTPTYRLHVGSVGRSHAFEIAARLGLPASLIEDAGGRMDREKALLGETMAALHERQETLRLREEESRREREAMEERLQAAAEESRRVRERAEEEADRLLGEALEQVERAKREADEALRALTVAREEADWQSLLAARERILAARGPLKRSRRTAPLPSAPGTLIPGQEVRIRSLGQRARVIGSADSRGFFLVEAGSARLRLPPQDLESLPATATVPKSRPRTSDTGRFLREKGLSISPELDLRGLSSEEAVARVDKYLDDVLLAGLSQVRLIHGKGTGSLRAAVTALLERSPVIADFRLGLPGEGGDGVTVVRLSP